MVSPISYPIRQIAFFVDDIEKAALAHHRQFGSGPYFIAHNIALQISRYRGKDRPLDHSSAYGQWGQIMVEFVQQNNAGPSVFHDLYPEGSGRTGLHHLAIIVDELAEAIDAQNKLGFETALYAETETGLPFAMVDMVHLYGHMLELYPSSSELVEFYDMVESAANGFDGTDPIRKLGL